jgi:hypothetical protein
MTRRRWRISTARRTPNASRSLLYGLYLSANGGPGGEFIYSEPGYTALVDAVASAGGIVVGVPLNEHLENDLTWVRVSIGLPEENAIARRTVAELLRS